MTDENATEENLEKAVEPEEVEEPQGTETDWKAEARKWERRAKEANGLRDAAEKWQEYERSLKPVQERLAEELEASKQEAISARVELMRYEVATDKGIPSEAVSLLTGSTREELEANADTLMAIIAKQSEPKQPKPDLSQGRPVVGGNATSDQFAQAISNLI